MLPDVSGQEPWWLHATIEGTKPIKALARSRCSREKIKKKFFNYKRLKAKMPVIFYKST